MDDPIVRDFMVDYAVFCGLLRESARMGLTDRDLRLLREKAELVLERAHEPAAREPVLLLVEAKVAPDPEQFLVRVRDFLAYMRTCRHPSELDPERMKQFREGFVLSECLKLEVRASISSSAQVLLSTPAVAL